MKINASRILLTQFDGDGAVFDIEENTYLSLTDSSYRIVSGIDKGYDRDTIVLSLCAEYSIAASDSRSVVDQAIAIMLQKEYILE